jgi:hypothetical protein
MGDERSLGCSRNDVGAIAEQVVNQHRAGIHIIISSSGTVDDHWSPDTVTELCQGVRVIPSATVLAHAEGVRASVTWSESALCNARYTILIVSAVLVDTVPVNLCLLALP